MAPELLKGGDLPQQRPNWKRSPWVTRRLIREAKLAAARVGRTLCVTDGALSAFVSEPTAKREVAR